MWTVSKQVVNIQEEKFEIEDFEINFKFFKRRL